MGVGGVFWHGWGKITLTTILSRQGSGGWSALQLVRRWRTVLTSRSMRRVPRGEALLEGIPYALHERPVLRIHAFFPLDQVVHQHRWWSW